METTKDKVREFLTWLEKERDFEFHDTKDIVIIFLEPGEYVYKGKAYKNSVPLPFQDEIPWEIIWAR